MPLATKAVTVRREIRAAVATGSLDQQSAWTTKPGWSEGNRTMMSGLVDESSMKRVTKVLRVAVAAGLGWGISTAHASPRTCEAVWRDAERVRDVPVRIRLPDGARSAPIILFSHGLGGSLDAGTSWAKAWVEAGFAVVHLQHPGSDLAALRGRGLEGLAGSMSGQQLVARARDVSFVIDQLGSRRSEGECDLRRLDLSRVGMSGHSFGAHTTLAVGGQSFAGRVSPLRDPRVTAAVALSPAPPAGADAAAINQAFGSVTLPVLMITGTRDESLAGLPLTPADRQKPFAAVAPGNKYLLVFEGADHMTFGGHLRREPTANDLRVTRAVMLATTAFWRATLLSDREAKAALASGGLVERSLTPADHLQRR